jgi:hypothetical protein
LAEWKPKATRCRSLTRVLVDSARPFEASVSKVRATPSGEIVITVGGPSYPIAGVALQRL